METPKLSPAKINPTKLLPGTSISTKKISTKSLQNESISVLKSDLFIIKKQVFKVRDLIQTSTLIKQSELEKKRKSAERKKTEKQEDKLEAKPEKEEGKLKMPSVPKLGFLDRIKNFLFSILLGYISIKLLPHLPKLVGVVSTIGNVMEFMLDLGGNILDKVVTFIDWGYKAIDATRGFIKSVGGEFSLKIFDKFTGAVSGIITATITAALALSAMSGGDGGGGGPGGGRGGGPGRGGYRNGVRTGQYNGFNTRTSRGGSLLSRTGDTLGLERVNKGLDSNPVRNEKDIMKRYFQRFGRDKFIQRFGQEGLEALPGGMARSGVTNLARKGLVGLAGKGGAKMVLGFAKPFLKRLPIIGALIDFGLSVALGEDPGRAAFKAIGAGLLGTIGAAVGSLAFGFGGIIGGLLGSIGGDALGGALYDMFFGGKKPQQKNQKVEKKAGGGITRGNKPTGGKIGRTIKKPKRTIRTSPSKVNPGQSIGGEKKLKNIFPEVKSEDKGKKINTYGYMKSSYEKLSSAEAFGGLFALPLKAQLGQEPSKLDYQNAASGLNSWMQRTFSSEIMRTGGVGFAEGGKVEAGMFSNGEDMTKVIEKSLEESISSKVTAAINDLKKQLGLKPNEGEGKDKKSGEPDTDETYGGGSSDAGDYKELLDMIAGHESTSAGGYLAYNEGGAADGYKILGYRGPSGPNSPIKRKLTDMTVGEIMDHQDKKNPPIHAAGRYQIIGPTMRGLINDKSYGETGVSKTDKFDQATQDKLGIALIKYRLKTGATPENFVSEWRGLKFENRDKLQKAINKAKIGKIYKTGSSGSLSMGDGKFIQGNSGSSEGMHFHIGTNKPGDPSGPFDSGFQVAKHFLGKKSVYVGRSGEFIPAGAKDEEIKGYIRRGQAAHRQTELDLQIGGANGAGNKVAFPLALKNMTYSSNSGYGVKSDISGVNAFVGHGRYKPDGTVAPQDGSVSKRYSLGAPDFYAFHGKIGFASRDNMILKLHKGEMFKVVDKDSVDLFGTSLVQDIIDIENKSQLISRAPYIIEKLKQLSGYISPNDSQISQSVSSKPDMSILQSYAPYESGAEQTVVISREMIPIPILMGNSGSGGMIPSSSSSSVNTTYDRQFANA